MTVFWSYAIMVYFAYYLLYFNPFMGRNLAVVYPYDFSQWKCGM